MKDRAGASRGRPGESSTRCTDGGAVLARAGPAALRCKTGSAAFFLQVSHSQPPPAQEHACSCLGARTGTAPALGFVSPDDVVCVVLICVSPVRLIAPPRRVVLRSQQDRGRSVPAFARSAIRWMMLSPSQPANAASAENGVPAQTTRQSAAPSLSQILSAPVRRSAPEPRRVDGGIATATLLFVARVLWRPASIPTSHFALA